MKVEIKAGTGSGTINAPLSKSMAHRLLIAAAMAEGESIIFGITECDDVNATISVLEALGVKITIDRENNRYVVQGIDFTKAAPHGILNCNESGSTLRFLIPAATLCGMEVQFSGAGRLMERPLSVYEDIYKSLGGVFTRKNGILSVSGKLSSGEYTIPGNISSQFITGLIYALPHLNESSILHITPPFESRSYVEMTIDAIEKFGIHAKFLDQYTIGIESGRYRPGNVTVDGDYSGAAFIEALNILGSEINIIGLNPKSYQGDKVYLEYFKALSLGYQEIDIQNCPDLGPVLFAIAAANFGARFTGTRRLKIKESDRGAAMACELKKLGVNLDIEENSIYVHPAKLTAPTTDIDSHGDHRIVMSMAVLLTIVGGSICGSEAINKSYPDFFRDLKNVGIEVIEYDT